MTLLSDDNENDDEEEEEEQQQQQQQNIRPTPLLIVQQVYEFQHLISLIGI